MASVRRLSPTDPTSPWIVEYTDACGKRRRKTPKTGLKKDADRLRIEIEGELERGCHVAESASLRVDAGIDLFIRECEKRAHHGDMTNASVQNYVTATNRLRKLIGHHIASALSKAAIQAAIDEMSQTLAPTTVQISRSVGKMVFEHLIDAGFAKRNPFRNRFRMPRAERPLRIASREQLRTLLAAATTRAFGEKKDSAPIRHAALCLALFSTLRRGEICALRWQDIDFDKGIIHIRHSYSDWDGLKSTKTKAGVRSQSIVPQVEAALKALPGERGPDNFVLCNKTGGPICPDDMTNGYWLLLCKKAGMLKPNGRPLFRLHDMRHAAASLLIAEGLSILHVKEAMGHSNIKTTLGVYGHLFPEDKSIGVAAKAIAQSFDLTQPRPLDPLDAPRRSSKGRALSGLHATKTRQQGLSH